MSNDNNLKTITPEELQEALKLHKDWLRDIPTGKRLNLSGYNLNGTDLKGADLMVAYLNGAYLKGLT